MKPINNTRRALCLVVAGIAALTSAAVSAQAAYPERSITMVVGWPAGGSADALSRLVANEMGAALGQPVVVDNRAGAGSNIGSELVARAKPDGYTIMLATGASHGLNSQLYPRLSFKPIEDFAPIGMINTSPGTLLVPIDSPHKTLDDLLKAAKAAPGKLNYGSAGTGSSQHLAGAMFKKEAGLDITHIPFKGSGPAVTELMAGRIDMIITTGAMTFINSGKLRALAVASRERHPAMPDVPTFDQAGLKGFYTDNNWYGLVAPAGTPRTILDKLNAALNKVLSKPEVQKQFVDQGAFPGKPGTPDMFWTFVKNQMPLAAEAVRVSGAKAE